MDKYIIHIFPMMALVWFLSQTIKLIIKFVQEKKISFNVYLSTGMMPSSHSALVCSVSMSMALIYGFTSPFFVICLLLTIIVMHDAVKVRSAIGNNTRTLKNFLWEIIEHEYHKKNRALKSLEIEIRDSNDYSNERQLKKIDKMKKEIAELKNLDVVLGHSFTEVLVGAVLGVGVALFYLRLLRVW